ncbi:MAG: winged helix-turn-helix transcriptional regulator [Nitrosopumilus sp.]|nr:winged helix-turn-helix transcriptional regulator [Nitrosopumilus sp.]MDH3384939.1 winged helix-turn-helix transcriptional regulator [Nitrosopumilus sp.]
MRSAFNSNLKELDIMSWHVVERILIIFYENGSLKKSQITLKSGLKYNTCMRYLKWLEEKMEFITFELSPDHKNIKSIHLSSQGISFCKNKILEKINVNKNLNNIFLFA